MKRFWLNNKSNIIKISILLLLFILISIISMLIMMGFGLIYFDNGVQLNTSLFNSFKNSWQGWMMIILIQIGVTSLLCFIPGSSMAFIILIQSIFSKEEAWKSFLLAFLGVLLSSLIMYIIGRKGGYKICKHFLGEESSKKASKLLNDKCSIYFPLMMMFPIFPDDALIMIAGTLKMKMRWFIPSIVFGRGIGIATIVFGLSIIPIDKLTTPWHWILFILVCAILICLVFFLAHKFNKYLENKQKNNE